VVLISIGSASKLIRRNPFVVQIRPTLRFKIEDKGRFFLRKYGLGCFKKMLSFHIHLDFLGLPLALLGSGCAGARSSLGPALFRYAQKLGLAFGHPLPSLSLRRLCRLLAAEGQF